MPNGQQLGNQQILLLDAVAATDVGTWVPWAESGGSALEVSSPTSFSGTVELLGSNANRMPPNGYTITVADSPSITPGDILTVTISNPGFDVITASYTLSSGDTTTTLIATHLSAAINTVLSNTAKNVALGQQANLAAAYLNCTSLNAVITINWTAPFAQYGLTTSLSAGATETLTIATYDSGLGEVLFSTTALVNQPLSVPTTWIKASVTSYSSGTISAILQTGVTPTALT